MRAIISISTEPLNKVVATGDEIAENDEPLQIHSVEL